LTTQCGFVPTSNSPLAATQSLSYRPLHLKSFLVFSWFGFAAPRTPGFSGKFQLPVLFLRLIGD
jgi:hypothetical protein